MLQALRQSVARFLGRAPQPQGDSGAALEAMQDRYARLRATYDAVRSSDEFKKYWANADRYDADSAHNQVVRHTAIARSRYEIGNNGYSDGIAQTSATDLVGTGPALRMQSGSEGFNQLVEYEWDRWAKSIKFRRKLWCMAHAKHSDGESFGVVRRNQRISHPIKLDVQLYEAEQIQSLYVPIGSMDYIDGVKFDEFGNPLWYDLLRHHPGATNVSLLNVQPERIPARNMLHWYKLRRPGQHRAVPEMMSTLNTGAAARRWREATLSAAERAALLTLMMKTQMQPDQIQKVAPFSTMDVEKGMMTYLPQGWDPFQADGKFPTATHEAFQKSLINEQARPKSMPYNKAACDSSSYNYASGRLDHQTYYASIDVEREDCNDLALDPLFSVWFDMAVLTFGWLGGNPDAITDAARVHSWDWPKHQVADVEAEANANQTKLKSGQVGLGRLYSDAGLDFDDEIEEMATTFGITVDDMRKRLLDVILPPVQQGGAPGMPTAGQEALLSVLAKLEQRNGHKLNGNGVQHAN